MPSTPVHQRGPHAATVPQTPTSSRRQALYERVRARSIQNTPTKANPTGAPMSKDQLLKLGQEEMRRCCLLGRLSGVAESVWMYVPPLFSHLYPNTDARVCPRRYFSNPGGSACATPGARKRRAMPASEVAAAVVKSSPVPLSIAEAHESLNMLVKLCPFFIQTLDVSGEEWLEMPASSGEMESDSGSSSATASPSKGKGGTREPGSVPGSPSKLKARDESAEELLTRSPRRVKREGGGLREVRERIRRELEAVE